MSIDLNESYKVTNQLISRYVVVRREDKRYEYPLPHHLKMGALEAIVIRAKLLKYKLIGAFCTTHGIWPFGLPHLAAKHGLKSIVVYPSMNEDKIPDELKVNIDGYELHTIKPNMVTINGAQAKKYIEDQYGYYIPFGVDEPLAVKQIADQLHLDGIGTLIVPCGSGVTLAGALMSIEQNKSHVENIAAVSAGRAAKSIIKTVSKYVQIPSNVRWVTRYEYNDIPKIECPWPAHPYYELKAYDWMIDNLFSLYEPIHFMNIGSY